ncbi:hypothetical protein, partial [Streptomyces nigra]|uniref:hypothetical protein n=1 Tax=Streptomyces nigra TaxID=1827580 RepID=UPI00341AF14F
LEREKCVVERILVKGALGLGLSELGRCRRGQTGSGQGQQGPDCREGYTGCASAPDEGAVSQ